MCWQVLPDITLLAKARRLALAAGIGSSARIVDYVITLGNARIATLATALGVLQKLTLSCIAILVPMFYWAMKWQRRPINTSKPCSLRATGGARRLTASSLSAS